MTGTVILGNRARGRRCRAITLSTTIAMQAMKTAIGFLVAARVRNIGLLQPPQPAPSGRPRRGGRRGADLLSLPDEIGAADDNRIGGLQPSGDLDALAGGLSHVDVLLADLPVVDEPDVVLRAERLHRGQR